MSKLFNVEKTSIILHFKLSPLMIWIALWIVNKYSEFTVNIFSNIRDITKCLSFLHDDDANAIEISRDFPRKQPS